MTAEDELRLDRPVAHLRGLFLRPRAKNSVKARVTTAEIVVPLSRACARTRPASAAGSLTVNTTLASGYLRPPRRPGLVGIPPGLPRRDPEPARQHPRGLRRGHARLQQVCSGIDTLSLLTSTHPAITSHAITVLPDMSLIAGGTPRPFQPPVAQRDIKAEVIYCVGGVLSPLLSNIYLNRLDRYVETTLLPVYNQGDRRRPYLPYMRLHKAVWKLEKKGQREGTRQMRRQLQQLPSRDPDDPGYRRLHYIRYADDWLLGYTGTRREAEDIKGKIGRFLGYRLKLELSERKTLITHGRTEPARFLGYEIVVHDNDAKHDRNGHRCINAAIGLKVPMDVVRAKRKPYMRRGKPAAILARAHDSDFRIVARYQEEFRGIAEYYQLAYNRHRLGLLRWIMERSLTKTLGHKNKISVSKVWNRYRATWQTPAGPRRGLQVKVERGKGKRPLVARWGGVSLARRTTRVILKDDLPAIWRRRPAELIGRLRSGRCELCQAHTDVETHHVRRLKDLHTGNRADQPDWARQMASRRRKTLIVCRDCHDGIHNGLPARQASRNAALESDVR